MAFASWCCVCLDDGADNGRLVVEANDAPLGLPQGFSLVDEGEDETIRIDFALPAVVEAEPEIDASPFDRFKWQQIPPPVAAGDTPTTLPRFSGGPPKPTKPPQCSEDGKIPPPVVAGDVPTLLPRFSAAHASPPKSAEEKRIAAGLHTTRSRMSASTGPGFSSACEESGSDSDLGDEPCFEGRACKMTRAAWGGSSNSVCTTAGTSATEEQPMILYPWEADEALCQASPSNASSPRACDASAAWRIMQWKEQRDQGSRAQVFYVDLRRERGRKLGLDTRPLMSDVTGALSVERIRSSGLVAEWNRSVANAAASSRPSGEPRKRRVRRGDLIIDVNGVSGNSKEMFKVITQEGKLRLLVMRAPGSAQSRSGRADRRRQSDSGTAASSPAAGPEAQPAK
mmetsp:Transcript_54593/g.158582  ORF Transcript_54593/g.158582 Transcript_54593/m.158582 type:complete len:398 (+) Transcript_54593:64-1257(+)